MLDQFPSFGFFLCFIYLSVSFFFFLVLFLFLFQPKLSLFVNFLVLFRFHSKICIWVFVWWKTGVFAQAGSTLTFSLTICTATLCTLWGLRGGECPWATLWLSSSCTKLVFWGLSEFQPKLSHSLSPPSLYLSLPKPSTKQS